MKEFHFYTENGIVRSAGRRANNLQSLLEGIKQVSGSSIFYHMHHAILRRHIISSDTLNDFARWTWFNLGEQRLAEQLAIVDPMECVSVRQARDKVAETVSAFASKEPLLRKVAREKEFCFLELQSFVLPTKLVARNLQEFYLCLQEVGPGSIFYHLIEARIRLGKQGSDFSKWLAEDLREYGLAARIDSLSPYVYNLWDLKQEILKLVSEREAVIRG